ncbi:MAG TPA: SH3 domain-containing protein [Spirochaetota bacterium]|nr:SH3 domain-containing protein [Spirochaetota bacterium]
MGIISILFFLLSVNSITSSENLKSSVYETKYITSESIDVKKKPALSSDVIMQIPYGTRVQVKKTDLQVSYEGKNVFWYLLENQNSYIIGSDLSDKKPKKQKKYKVTQYAGWESCPDIEITLYLNNMEAELSASFRCHVDMTTYKQTGSYELKNDYIQLKLNECMEYTKDDDGKATKKKRNGEIVNLFWFNNVHAWLIEDDINKINFYKKNCEIKANGRYSFIDCCEFYKKDLELKKNKTEWDEIELSNWPDMCHEIYYLYSK